ncbi:hypothetical protein [Streptomyces sp. ALI-76-A]|uniref:hypothetical protein n=1 Tax=Streptomyces sp. ALI-76-A TaxID=3025736 RepID=UPI003364B60C
MAGETKDQGEGGVVNGRSRLSRTLGAGGMGRVWLVYDEDLACEVATKEIALADVPRGADVARGADEPATGAPREGSPEREGQRARSEVRHAARPRGHPHVATVHDLVVHKGLSWISWSTSRTRSASKWSSGGRGRSRPHRWPEPVSPCWTRSPPGTASASSTGM